MANHWREEAGALGLKHDGTEADAKRVVLEEFERQLRKTQQQVDCPLRKAMGGMKL